MVNISYFVLSFFLLDYKQVEKRVFKLCNHVRFISRSVVFRWWGHLIFISVSSYHEWEEHEIQWTKENLKDISSVQFIPLLPFRILWMDWKTIVISCQTKNWKRALKMCPLSSEEGFKLSGGLWRAYLNFGWWEKGDEHRENMHKQRQHMFTGAHSVSSNHMSRFKAQTKDYSVCKESNKDHMSSLVQPWGNRMVNISLGLELNSFQMKTYFSLWRWVSTICACLLILQSWSLDLGWQI